VGGAVRRRRPLFTGERDADRRQDRLIDNRGELLVIRQVVGVRDVRVDLSLRGVMAQHRVGEGAATGVKDSVVQRLDPVRMALPSAGLGPMLALDIVRSSDGPWWPVRRVCATG